mgnify:CR=1
MKQNKLDSNNKGSIGDRFRSKRFRFFEQFLSKYEGNVSILDVGGTENFWKNRNLDSHTNVKITLLNLSKEDTTLPYIASVAGDATNMNSFNTGQFDVVFSNSVIEHLYTFKNQRSMASECRRVGKYFFVQTPNKYFFLEPHYLLPYFQFVPKKIGFWLLTKTILSRGYRWSDEDARQYLEEIRLLSLNEFSELFEHGAIYHEKFLGMSKSYTAHNFPIEGPE